MKKSFEYVLFAEFQQFYLQDEWAEESPDNSWTTEANYRLLAIEPGIVRVGTIRAANVPVVVEIAGSEPNDDMSAGTK
jgi:hypothetical protein